MSNSEIRTLLCANGKFKQRSHGTHFNTHKPELEQLLKTIQHGPATAASQTTTSQPTTAPNDTPLSLNPPWVILLGSSMLERFKTTGRQIPNARIALRPHTYNAGVGGDKIESVLYRLHLGLLHLTTPLAPKLYVVHVGTNNLRPKGGLRPFELENYNLLLRALLSASSADVKVLVVAVFWRRDIEDGYVASSNEGIKGVVEKRNREEGRRRVWFVEQPEELGKRHLVDQVHLNREGYAIWDRVLMEKIEEVLGSE